jgi:uncharacterized protein (DUF2267 family)
MDQSELSWTGEGMGTNAASFIRKVMQFIPEYPPVEVSHAVFCTLSERLSGGLVQQLEAQLPSDLRHMLSGCGKKTARDPDGHFDKDEFYGAVAEHVNAQPGDVRRILFAVFAALHAQITAREADKVASELPADLKSTWHASRRVAERPA